MKLTIGKKLLGCFLLALLLLIIENAVANQLISSTEESYRQLIDQNIENVLLANQLENHHWKQSGSVKNYLLTDDSNYIVQYEENAQNVNTILNKMSKTYDSSQDQEYIQQLLAFQERYKELVEKAIIFKKNGNEIGYNNLLNTSAKTVTNVFEGKIHVLVTGQEAIVKQRSEEVARSVQKIKQAMVFFGIVIFLIGTSLAVSVGRSISRPLYLLAQFTEKIITPGGNFNLELPKVKSNLYEVNQLYHSFHLAFQRIKDHIHQLDIEVQTDALTKIANRRTFDLVTKEQIQNQISFALILLDIDFFKKINDTYGHLKGDEALTFLAKHMQELCREGDLCFRYGGEEFAIIVPYGDADTATVIAERLRTKLESIACPTGEVMTVSLGISLYPKHGQNIKEIISAADQALYTSKSEGRNKTTLYSKDLKRHRLRF